MRFRATWIMLAVLAALAAFVFLWERKQPEPAAKDATPMPTSPAPLFSFSTSEIHSLRVERPETGEALDLEQRDPGLWYIVAPFEELADEDQVSYLVQSLSWLAPTRVLDSSAKPVDYELDPGTLVLEITLQDGTKHALTFGAQTPAGSGYYAQVKGDSSIYVLGYYFYDQADWLIDDPPVAPTPSPTLESIPTETSTP